MDLLRPTRKIELRGYRHGFEKAILNSYSRVFTVFDLEQDPGEQQPKNGSITDKTDPFAVRVLAFLEASQKVRHKVGMVKESTVMTSQLDELGYTED